MTDATASNFIATPDRATPAIRIGDIFSETWKMFAAHWAIYSGIVMIAHAPLAAVHARNEWTTTTGGAPTGFAFSASILGSLVGLAILIVANAVIYFGVSQDIGGRPFSTGQSIGAALRVSLALMAVTVLTWIYAMFAALLLFFPGFIVFCMYAVASPACVVERIGPIKAMSRSAFLTKGNRWRIFGFLLLLSLGVPLLSVLIIFAAKLAGGAIFSIAVSLPVRGVAGGFTAVAMAVLYAQLRTVREGVDVDHIAAVFD